MTKQKNSINITPDDELLALIDKEAAKDLRTRKAQVLYIIREHFNQQEKKLEAIEKIRKETEDFKESFAFTPKDLLEANLLERVNDGLPSENEKDKQRPFPPVMKIKNKPEEK